MIRAPSPRPIKRRRDELLIFLHPDEWASDVPLPEGSTIVHLGENHEIPFHPQWHFFLQPDQTVELLVGYFILPLSFEDAIVWNQTELAKQSWIRGPKEGYYMPPKALLRFQHPETCARVEISLLWWDHRQETTAMIRRVVEHPWTPVAEQPLELTAEIA